MTFSLLSFTSYKFVNSNIFPKHLVWCCSFEVTFCWTELGGEVYCIIALCVSNSVKSKNCMTGEWLGFDNTLITQWFCNDTSVYVPGWMCGYKTLVCMWWYCVLVSSGVWVYHTEWVRTRTTEYIWEHGVWWGIFALNISEKYLLLLLLLWYGDKIRKPLF